MDFRMKFSLGTMKAFGRTMTRLGAISVVLALCACNGADSAGQGRTAAIGATAATNSTPVAVTQPKGNPQPKLPLITLWVGTNKLSAEIASTYPQISTGMMFRTNMAEMEAMLFVFPTPQQVAFYMRNTLLPLSCAYIDPEGTILETYEMKPLDETPLPSKSSQVQYVLEVNQGWFERHGVKPGMVISTDRGTFQQTFRRR